MTQPSQPQAPSIGRIVHCSFLNHRGIRVVRPAIVVQAWPGAAGVPGPDSLLNLQVFTDGANDEPSCVDKDGSVRPWWATSVHAHHGEGPHPDAWVTTWWFWPPRT